MAPATVEFPYGFYSQFAPGSVDITWDNQPIELINGKTDEYGDSYVEVYVTLGVEAPQIVNAYLMYSPGFNDGGASPLAINDDICQLSISLWELDNLWDFECNTILIKIPEGIVKNKAGLLNPAQEFTFYLMDGYTSFDESPATGSTLTQNDAIVTVSFGGNPLQHLQGEVEARCYFPSYENYQLKYGSEVTIINNKLIIDLSSLEPNDYELVIPEGYVTVEVDGEKYLSPDLWFDYTIVKGEESSVNEINSAETVSEVYNLNGIKVSDTIAIKNGNISKGIYIINGKKIVIK